LVAINVPCSVAEKALCLSVCLPILNAAFDATCMYRTLHSFLSELRTNDVYLRMFRLAGTLIQRGEIEYGSPVKSSFVPDQRISIWSLLTLTSDPVRLGRFIRQWKHQQPGTSILSLDKVIDLIEQIDFEAALNDIVLYIQKASGSLSHSLMVLRAITNSILTSTKRRPRVKAARRVGGSDLGYVGTSNRKQGYVGNSDSGYCSEELVCSPGTNRGQGAGRFRGQKLSASSPQVGSPVSLASGRRTKMSHVLQDPREFDPREFDPRAVDPRAVPAHGVRCKRTNFEQDEAKHHASNVRAKARRTDHHLAARRPAQATQCLERGDASVPVIRTGVHLAWRPTEDNEATAHRLVRTQLSSGPLSSGPLSSGPLSPKHLSCAHLSSKLLSHDHPPYGIFNDHHQAREGAGLTARRRRGDSDLTLQTREYDSWEVEGNREASGRGQPPRRPDNEPCDGAGYGVTRTGDGRYGKDGKGQDFAALLHAAVAHHKELLKLSGRHCHSSSSSVEPGKPAAPSAATPNFTSMTSKTSKRTDLETKRTDLETKRTDLETKSVDLETADNKCSSPKLSPKAASKAMAPTEKRLPGGLSKFHEKVVGGRGSSSHGSHGKAHTSPSSNASYDGGSGSRWVLSTLSSGSVSPNRRLDDGLSGRRGGRVPGGRTRRCSGRREASSSDEPLELKTHFNHNAVLNHIKGLCDGIAELDKKLSDEINETLSKRLGIWEVSQFYSGPKLPVGMVCKSIGIFVQSVNSNFASTTSKATMLGKLRSPMAGPPGSP
ncbi:hypothetical protein GNI_026700, partial [Gregarina niphandrodes]